MKGLLKEDRQEQVLTDQRVKWEDDMMKKRWLSLFMALAIGLPGCGRTDGSSPEATDPGGYEAVSEEETPDPWREKLERLREVPSVNSAVISSYKEGEEYKIDLEEAIVSVIKLSSREEIKEYPLDSGQVEGLRQLLSEYTLTVYDGAPYWPTGEYCTMIELFGFYVNFDKGYYDETGALGYPEGWGDFMEKLKAFVTG